MALPLCILALYWELNSLLTAMEENKILAFRELMYLIALYVCVTFIFSKHFRIHLVFIVGSSV